MMNKIKHNLRFVLFILLFCCLSFATVNADDDVKVVISTSKSTNYVLYPAMGHGDRYIGSLFRVDELK